MLASAPPLVASLFVKENSVLISRYLLFLVCAFLLISPAWAQSTPVAEQPCGDTVTTTCLVGEIQAFLASDINEFQRERAMVALGQAQLADGRVEEALASYEQLKAKTARVEFLISHAKQLIAGGDNAGGLERLREANSLLTEGQSDLERLNATGHSQMIAETFAKAGAAEEGFAILDGIADYRNRIPMNPMLLALMLQIGKSEADIGFGDEAAALLAETYELLLDQGLEVQPEQVLRIFAVWAPVDGAAATTAAEELAAIIGEDGPSAFEFAIWAGLSAGLAASGDDAAPFMEKAQASLADAPERAAALQLAPRLADAMREAGENEQARALLDQARAEAMDLPSAMEKASVLLALAEGFARADAADEAMEVLESLLAVANGSAATAEEMMLRHFASMIPAQLASIGRSDEAYDRAMKDDGDIREMSLILAADKLAIRGDYRDAMRFLRNVESEVAVMMMAGMAERLAGISNQPGEQ